LIKLSDKEKLIIASLYLQKNLNYTKSLDERVKMLQDYSLSLNVPDKVDLYKNLQIEELNFISLFTLMGVSFISLEPSNFNNLEKFITYQTELVLVVGEIPYAVKAEFSKKLGEDLGIQNPKLYLKLIADQINELEKFITYLNKSKNL
jgi:hypothetical protein